MHINAFAAGLQAQPFDLRRRRGSTGEYHRIEFAAKFVQLLPIGYGRIHPQFDAEPRDLGDLRVENVARQIVLAFLRAQPTAQFRLLLDQRTSMSGAAQIVDRSQAGGPLPTTATRLPVSGRHCGR